MSNTKQVLDFTRSTTHALENISDALSSIRFDLFGSRPEPSSPSTPKSPTPVGQCFTTDVEIYAGRTNEALNRIAADIEFLRERVNHMDSPKGTI